MHDRIETFQDLLDILDARPEWAQALRERLLTPELLALPERFATFSNMVEHRLHNLETDTGDLKGHTIPTAVQRMVGLVAQTANVRRPRWLDNTAIVDIADDAAEAGKADNPRQRDDQLPRHRPGHDRRRQGHPPAMLCHHRMLVHRLEKRRRPGPPKRRTHDPLHRIPGHSPGRRTPHTRRCKRLCRTDRSPNDPRHPKGRSARLTQDPHPHPAQPPLRTRTLIQEGRPECRHRNHRPRSRNLRRMWA